MKYKKIYSSTILMVILTVAALANAYYYFFWLADDSYISIRYALNYIDQGVVFYNQHELETGLVQGFSNPGMIPVYWFLLKTTSDVMLALKVLGTISIVGTTLIVFNLCRCVCTGWKAAFIAGLTVALSPIMGVPASSGLETIFLALLLTTSFRCLISDNYYLKLVSAAGLVICISMRPEGIALFLVIIIFFIF